MNSVFPPKFLTDFPEGYVPPGTYLPPLTVPEFLTREGLTDAPRAEQDAAIAEYLRTHEPSLGFVLSLANHGYYRRRAGSWWAGRRLGRAAVNAAWHRAKEKHGFA